MKDQPIVESFTIKIIIILFTIVLVGILIILGWKITQIILRRRRQARLLEQLPQLSQQQQQREQQIPQNSLQQGVINQNLQNIRRVPDIYVVQNNQQLIIPEFESESNDNQPQISDREFDFGQMSAMVVIRLNGQDILLNQERLEQQNPIMQQAHLLMERQQQLLWGLSFLHMIRGIEEDSNRTDTSQRAQQILKFKSQEVQINRASDPTATTEDYTCIICFEEFKDSEVVRSINHCKHWFHNKCITEWIQTKINEPTCPLCKHSLLN